MMKDFRLHNVAEITVSYSHKVDMRDQPQIRSSRNAYDIFASHWSDQMDYVEEFNILLLNRSNRVLAFANVSKGGVSGTVVDAKVVFGIALKANASAIILAHNHPSGNLRPSQADLDLTKKLKAGGEFLDITVLDHLIMTSREYSSMADESWM